MKLFLIACVLFCWVSCTTTTVEPTRTSRHTIDTLFQQKIILLKPEMDSLCRIMHAEVYKKAVDSLLVARKVEMEFLVE